MYSRGNKERERRRRDLLEATAERTGHGSDNSCRNGRRCSRHITRDERLAHVRSLEELSDIQLADEGAGRWRAPRGRAKVRTPSRVAERTSVDAADLEVLSRALDLSAQGEG